MPNPRALLRELSYYKTGGDYQELCAPETVEELSANLARLHAQGTPWFVLGLGSNSLVSDEVWDGAVVSLHRMKALTHKGGGLITCGAGVINSDLAQLALDLKLSGAGWMYRLPGQMGGTTRMNARCYGGEMSEIVSSVTTVSPAGEIKIYPVTPQRKSQIFRGYKDTVFMENREIIASVSVQLREGADPEELWKAMKFCEDDRTKKLQFTHPSCGCVFKNDYSPEVSVSSGLLLDMCRAKELSCGGAQVSEGHANFVFNLGSATSRDILEISIAMRERVWAEFGVWLEYEMEILGHIPEDLKPKVLEKRPPAYRKERLAEARQKFMKPRVP